MQRDNCDKFEAMDWLCSEYNISRPDWTPEQKQKKKQQQDECAEIRELIKECFEFYHQTMTDKHREYYHKRGLTDETIDNVLCGYAQAGGKVLLDEIIKRHGPDCIDQLLKTGMFFRFDSGAIRDRYHNRYVMPYPFKDEIPFSIGRSIDPNIEDYKKYVKHLTQCDKYPYVSDVAVQHIIYGEDTVRGAKEVIITEGIFDVMLAIQTGYTAISPITTKFSNRDNQRLAELCKHAETVYMLNDNEESKAGETGAIKTAKVLTEAGINVKLGLIPRPENKDKVDLADFIVEAGDKAKEQVDQLLVEAVDLITYQLNTIPQDIDRLELLAKVEALVAEAIERGEQKDWLKQWLKTRVKDRFELTARDVQDYQSMLTRISKEYEQGVKEQEQEQRRRERQQELDELKKTNEAKYLKALIHDVRVQPVKAFQIKQSVSSIILKDLMAYGKFYRTNTDRYYHFSSETKRLVEIGDANFAHYTDLRYRLNRTETEYEYLIADLEAYTASYGELTEVYRFAHYELNTKNLYVDKNDHHVYRLNGETIDLVPNGDDGVLFISGNNEPFEMVDIGEQKFIKPLVIEPTNFTMSADVALNKKEQEYLLSVWLSALFFEELQPTKPIQLMLGAKGSGKTTRQKIIGKWLVGKEFNVQGINDKEDSFLATISNSYLASFDNVDTYQDWLNDRLAQCATGQVIEKRKLYTTNEVARYYPRVFITLNSREPKFKRDDVVDRLLLFRVERLSSFKSEARILKEIADNRDKLWSEFLQRLNAIVKWLKEDTEPFTTSYRMADFAELGWRISKSIGAGDVWLELLDKMSKDKSEFLLLDAPVYQVISGLVAGGKELKDRTSAQLYKIFKEYADKEDIEFSYIKNARSLGQKLSSLLHDLRAYFNIERAKEAGNWRYSICAKENE